jgi:hypothetical protein
LSRSIVTIELENMEEDNGSLGIPELNLTIEFDSW